MQAEWCPFFWEPVAGTGERLMAGVVLNFGGEWIARRTIRDDVLDGLYGRTSANPGRLIEEALQVLRTLGERAGVEALSALKDPVFGLHSGEQRVTEALSVSDAVRQAVLLHASLASLDSLQATEEADVPAPEEGNKRFATEVREAVVAERPDLAGGFGKLARLTNSGRPVPFGYLSPQAILHFAVIHAARQPRSLRDARARLWELARARAMTSIERAALIAWLPADTDPTIGAKQREGLHAVKVEIEEEADEAEMRLLPVQTIFEARDRVIELAG